MSVIRYDRQIRLWGDEGQSSIEKASVCVLGSSSLAAEILKSLALPGIGRFCIVDDAIVDETDLGQNFFLTKNDLGKLRASVLTKYLLELNPSVKGTFCVENCKNISSKLYSDLLSFSIVISTCLTDNAAAKLASYLYSHNTYFIYTRVCGMFGYLRLCFRQHVILNIHTEHSPHDFRLDDPFDEILEMANSQDLDSMTHEKHLHTPYLLLYIKALKKWRELESREISDNNSNQELFPDTYQKRKAFERVLWSMRKADEKGSLVEENFEEAKRNLLKSFPSQKFQIPERVQVVLNDAKALISRSNLNEISLLNGTCDSTFRMELLRPFWVFAAAIRRFTERHNGRLPLSGKIPDMFSDSERYIEIQRIYRNKAAEHAKEVFEIANEIYSERRQLLNDFITNVKNSNFVKNLNDLMEVDVEENGKVEHKLSWTQCQEFCRNVSKIAVQNDAPLSDEFATGIESILQQIIPLSPIAGIEEEELENGELKPFVVDPLVWFVLIRAMDRFYYEKNRFPGTNGVPCTIDSKDLKRRLYDLVSETKNEVLIRNIDKIVPQEAINEICRYGAAEPHVIAAIIGGVVAQEAIKLVTHQYLPLDNALIYDGHLQSATSFRI